jgi:hypothetical protein
MPANAPGNGNSGASEGAASIPVGTILIFTYQKNFTMIFYKIFISDKTVRVPTFKLIFQRKQKKMEIQKKPSPMKYGKNNTQLLELWDNDNTIILFYFILEYHHLWYII